MPGMKSLFSVFLQRLSSECSPGHFYTPNRYRCRLGQFISKIGKLLGIRNQIGLAQEQSILPAVIVIGSHMFGIPSHAYT